MSFFKGAWWKLVSDNFNSLLITNLFIPFEFLVKMKYYTKSINVKEIHCHLLTLHLNPCEKINIKSVEHRYIRPKMVNICFATTNLGLHLEIPRKFEERLKRCWKQPPKSVRPYSFHPRAGLMEWPIAVRERKPFPYVFIRVQRF